MFDSLCNNFTLLISYIVTPQNNAKINQSINRSKAEFLINKFITLSTIPAIKNTVIYGPHELKSLLVL